MIDALEELNGITQPLTNPLFLAYGGGASGILFT